MFCQSLPGVVAVLLVSIVGLTCVALPYGGTPPAPICGRTIVFSKAVDGVQLLTEGGEFTVKTLTYIGLSPQGEFFCPTDPASATIDITLSCDGGPGGSGSLETTVFPGYNEIDVPVTVLAGPPRLCDVVGTITVEFSDGMILSQSGDTVVCIVEPAPGDPDVPRLDLSVLSPPIQNVHPGDQTTTTVCITNNDPSSSWTGSLTATTNSTGPPVRWKSNPLSS